MKQDHIDKLVQLNSDEESLKQILLIIKQICNASNIKY